MADDAAFGGFFSRRAYALTAAAPPAGPHDPDFVAKMCYTAAFIYACFFAFCGLQVSLPSPTEVASEWFIVLAEGPSFNGMLICAAPLAVTVRRSKISSSCPSGSTRANVSSPFINATPEEFSCRI